MIFCDLFLLLALRKHMRSAYMIGGVRRRGGTISVDLSLIVLVYNINFMNKLKFNDLKKILKQSK